MMLNIFKPIFSIFEDVCLNLYVTFLWVEEKKFYCANKRIKGYNSFLRVKLIIYISKVLKDFAKWG